LALTYRPSENSTSNLVVYYNYTGLLQDYFVVWNGYIIGGIKYEK